MAEMMEIGDPPLELATDRRHQGNVEEWCRRFLTAREAEWTVLVELAPRLLENDHVLVALQQLVEGDLVANGATLRVKTMAVHLKRTLV